MADVRQRFGGGAYDFVHQIYNRGLLERPKIPRKIATHASSLLAACEPGDIQDGGLMGAGRAADARAGGASRDIYTTATPALEAHDDVGIKGNVSERHCNLGENLLSNETQIQVAERNLPRCWRSEGFRRIFRSCGPYSRCLCWGQGQFVFIREYNGKGAKSVPLHKTKIGYYDILEVSPSATQAQIKTAYYKQSFVYHPDRNAGSDAASVRFSEISEAYAVLRNKALRKKYDRGLLSLSDLTATARPSAKDSAGSSARQQTRSRGYVVGANPRGGVFDFDQFFKSRYSDQLQRERELRFHKEERLKEKQNAMIGESMDRMRELCLGVLLLMTVGVIISLKLG